MKIAAWTSAVATSLGDDADDDDEDETMPSAGVVDDGWEVGAYTDPHKHDISPQADHHTTRSDTTATNAKIAICGGVLLSLKPAEGKRFAGLREPRRDTPPPCEATRTPEC